MASAPAQSGLSALFSLSDAAATAAPMPVVPDADDSNEITPLLNGNTLARSLKDSKANVLKHRRLSSTGQTRRRMSDARDAVSRPNPASLSAASTLASLSALTLTPSGITASVPTSNILHSHRGRLQSSTNGHGQGHTLSTSFEDNTPLTLIGGIASSVPSISFIQDLGDGEVDVEDFDDDAISVNGSSKKVAKGVKVKKRGTIFQCESCSKVYRHPSCLVKHRWEHSPHWREASKFLLSKHQQVQLLEAATILSHLGPSASLPDDRSLWPSYVSGGALPPPSSANASAMNPLTSPSPSSRSNLKNSSSVPDPSMLGARMDRTRSGSVVSSSSTSTSGPRLHDYMIKRGGEITQIRPGLLAQPTPSQFSTASRIVSNGSISPYNSSDQIPPIKPQPMSVPANLGQNTFTGYRNGNSNTADSSMSFSVEESSDGIRANGVVSASVESGAGSWGVPHSDIRSDSVSRSFSGSRSDDEPEGSDIEIDEENDTNEVHVEIGDYEDFKELKGLQDLRIKNKDISDKDYKGFSFAMRPNGGLEKVHEHTVKREDVDEGDGWVEMDMDM